MNKTMDPVIKAMYICFLRENVDEISNVDLAVHMVTMAESAGQEALDFVKKYAKENRHWAAEFVYLNSNGHYSVAWHKILGDII